MRPKGQQSVPSINFQYCHNIEGLQSKDQIWKRSLFQELKKSHNFIWKIFRKIFFPLKKRELKFQKNMKNISRSVYQIRQINISSSRSPIGIEHIHFSYSFFIFIFIFNLMPHPSHVFLQLKNFRF